jgi:hypothetical protein
LSEYSKSAFAGKSRNANLYSEGGNVLSEVVFLGKIQRVEASLRQFAVPCQSGTRDIYSGLSFKVDVFRGQSAFV